MRVILANGCFDVLHPGHVDHLEEARAMGDYLLVGLTLDRAVGKPGRPVQEWADRARMLRALRCVSEVRGCVSGLDALMRFGPAVFVKGSDYAQKGLLADEQIFCERRGIEIKFTLSVKRSTTDLIRKIREIH